jgi:quinol-cytochrome oxidoreductase complex cytochrome b subunit
MRRPSFFHHLHPPTVPAAQARWSYTLGAGGLCVLLVLVILVSGTLELFYYVPVPEQAPLSVQALTYLVPLGRLVRNLHYWASQALVVAALVHLLRVIFTGAYAPPRRFNYLLGLSLLVLILLLDWSGYVLRWDEGVRWALVVGTNLARSVPFLGDWLYRLITGGDQIGPPTLLRFYAAHIVGLMLPFSVLLGWHLFRVRRDGGIAAPPPELRRGAARLSRFELMRREVVAALLALAVLLLLAAFAPVPIAAPLTSLAGNPASADPYAPWFFLWIQGLVRLGDPFWMGIAVPVGVVLVIGLVPLILPAPPPEERGRWFPRGGRAAQIVAGVLIAAIAFLTVWARLQ